MDDLTAFLRAQWDVEEADARWSLENAPNAHQTDPNSMNFSPERVLRDVEAKRRILDEHAHIPGDGINFTLAEQGRAEETIQLLALPYADHHDYREEWKP